MFLFKLLSMATRGQTTSTFQAIQSHIEELNNSLTKIEERQLDLKEQKHSVEKELDQKLESLVDAVKKCRARALKELEVSYEEKWKKLEDAKKKLNERKTKAENKLVVDHTPMAIPDVGEFSYTIRVDEAMRTIEKIGPTTSSCSVKQETPSVKLENPDAKTTSAEKRRMEPSTSASASGAQSDYVSIPSKKTKVEMAPKRTVQTLRDFVKCTKCNKPRCVYSDRSLIKDDQCYWNVIKESLRYQCGRSLFSPLDEILNVEPVNCSEVVNWHCFGQKARERNLPVVCYHCGRELDASKAKLEESEDRDTSPVCDVCCKAGIKPRTRKKQRRPTTSSKSNIVIDEDDD